MWVCSAWMLILRELKAGPGKVFGGCYSGYRGSIMEPRILDQVELSSKGGCYPVDEGAAWARWPSIRMLLGKSGYSPPAQVLPSLGSCDSKNEPALHQLLIVCWEFQVPQVENLLSLAWRLLFIGVFFCVGRLAQSFRCKCEDVTKTLFD